MKKPFDQKAIFLIIINIFLVVFNFSIVFIAKKDPNFIEKYYSRKFFYNINKPLSYISSKFSFSLGEILIFILVIFILILLLKSLYNLLYSNFYRSIANLLILFLILLSILSFYQILWGLNNYRLTIEDNLNLHTEDIDIDDLANSYRYLVLESNKLKEEILAKDNEEITRDYIYNNVYKGFKNLNRKYPFISKDKIIVKPLIVSRVFSSSGYSGIYIPFLSEANVNSMIPMFSIPFTASHEIAHQRGFASEDSANFVGFLACYHSDNIYFKYSAFQAMISYVGNSLYKNNKELYSEISALRNQDLLNDIDLKRNFWKKHENKKSKEIHNKINDSFLKANNQNQGLATYSKVTELFVKAYKLGIIN